jgi:hypothetical protein
VVDEVQMLEPQRRQRYTKEEGRKLKAWQLVKQP